MWWFLMSKVYKCVGSKFIDSSCILYKGKSLESILQPVGSIYISIYETDPSTYFGGTWERLQGGFLYGSTATSGTQGTYGNGSGTSTGSTAITINQMPSHTHTQNSHYHSGARWKNSSGVPISLSTYDGDTTGYTTGYSSAKVSKTAFCTAPATATNKNTGGGKGHTHTIPYITVYIWMRTA